MSVDASIGAAVGPAGSISIRTVDRGAPWSWLAAGWQDYLRTWPIGCAYGAVFAGIGMALTVAVVAYGAVYLLLPLAAGFMLIGPVAAVGLYEVSRRLEAGRPVSLLDALAAAAANRGQLALMGVILLVVNLAWVRLATLLFALFFSEAPPRPELHDLLALTLSLDGLPFLAVGTLFGAGLAALVFAIGAVSIPLLLDRPEANVIDAVATSVEAVRGNFWAMTLWAWLIVMFVGAGLATGFIGLVITLPLIGHATWHAYRAVVATGGGSTGTDGADDLGETQ